MEINATIQVNLENGEMLLVLIVNSIIEQHVLYEYLYKNVDNVRSGISLNNPLVDYITAGYWREYNVLDWRMDYILLT